MQNQIKMAKSAAPTIDPTTIPAIAPPLSPRDSSFVMGLLVEDGVADEVGAVKLICVIDGSTTLAHLFSASEL